MSAMKTPRAAISPWPSKSRHIIELCEYNSDNFIGERPEQLNKNTRLAFSFKGFRENGKNQRKKQKRIIVTFGIMGVIILLLAFRLAWIQVVKAEEYSEIAAGSRPVTSYWKRGSIYDTNGEVLATSATCYTVWVRPSQQGKLQRRTDKKGKQRSGGHPGNGRGGSREKLKKSRLW